MKWATIEGLGNQGPQAAWIVRRFIDPEAEFLLFPKAVALASAREVGALTLYVSGGDFYKDANGTTVDALMERYGLRGRSQALDLMAEIFRDLSFRVKRGLPAEIPESPGIRALIVGFGASTPDPRTRLERMLQFYDALHAWCEQQTSATPSGKHSA